METEPTAGPPFLKDAKLFVAIVETGSATGACKITGQNQSTISRQVRKWENEFRCQLFERHSRGLLPTQKAVEIFHVCREALKIIEGIKHDKPNGVEDAEEEPEGV